MHRETAHSSFSSGLCVPRARKSQTIAYKSDSQSVLHWVFLGQKANSIQTPPKRDEAKYLQTRLQFCHFVVQKGKKIMFLQAIIF